MIAGMNDYDLVALLLRHPAVSRATAPSLDEIALWTGLSPAHLRELFARWVGRDPGSYLRAVHALRAGKPWQERAGAPDTERGSGFSGQGWSHELVVSLEGSGSGEKTASGEGWSLRAGFAVTPFGRALAAESPVGLCHLAFLEPWGEAEAWRDFQKRWPGAHVERCDSTASAWVGKIFDADQASGTTFRLHVPGTQFQLAVWRALLAIPFGETTTYGRLAETIGHRSASRATGTAVGRNPVAWLIPCHRVIRRDGVLGQYRWGPERKLAMLAWEHTRTGLPTPAAP